MTIRSTRHSAKCLQHNRKRLVRERRKEWVMLRLQTTDHAVLSGPIPLSQILNSER